jgi:hypothetical protein
VRTCLLLVAAVAFNIGGFAEDCKPDEFKSFANVSGAVHFFMTTPGVITSWSEKSVYRGGDSAAVAIIRTVPDSDFTFPEKARQVLNVLRLAFSFPQLIETCNDRQPRVTMLLLDHLQNVSGLQLQSEINEARLLIARHSTPEWPAMASPSDTNPQQTQWIGRVLGSVLAVKAGMLRKELLTVFTTEGGLSNRMQRTYVYKECPYIKVDVEFSPVDNPDDKLHENPGDRIAKISRPYLAYFIAD